MDLSITLIVFIFHLCFLETKYLAGIFRVPISGFFLMYGKQFISLWAWCSIYDEAKFGISHLNNLLPTKICIRTNCECFVCVCVCVCI